MTKGEMLKLLEQNLNPRATLIRPSDAREVFRVLIEEIYTKDGEGKDAEDKEST
jgi:hypothetical protein